MIFRRNGDLLSEFGHIFSANKSEVLLQETSDWQVAIE